MEAANRGAKEGGGPPSVGIELPHEQGLNAWVELGVDFRYFFVRKTMSSSTRKGSWWSPAGWAPWTSSSRR